MFDPHPEDPNQPDLPPYSWRIRIPAWIIVTTLCALFWYLAFRLAVMQFHG